jgi:hypothetical protein
MRSKFNPLLAMTELFYTPLPLDDATPLRQIKILCSDNNHFYRYFLLYLRSASRVAVKAAFFVVRYKNSM